MHDETSPSNPAAWLSHLDGLTPSELDALAEFIESDAMPLARRIWARLDDRIRRDHVSREGAGR